MQYADLCLRKLKDIGFRGFADKFLTVEGSSDIEEIRFFCPAHENTNTASASFNVTTGKWKCFSAECDKGGDSIDLYSYLINKPRNRPFAARALAIKMGWASEITDEVVERLVSNLYLKPSFVPAALKQFGISKPTLDKWRIGLNILEPNKNRFSIPILGESGEYEDIRLRNGEDPKRKVVSWRIGNGACRVFPIQTLQEFETVIIFAGEKDCLRAYDFGLHNAICFTGSEGSLPTTWVTLFKAKRVYICFDLDAAGKKGANTVVQALKVVAKAVYQVAIPEWPGMPKNADFSDWANKGGTLQQFQELLVTATANPAVTVSNLQQILDGSMPSPSDEVTEVSFQDLSTSEFHGKKIRMLAHVIGVSAGLKSYQATSVINCDCRRDRPVICGMCTSGLLEHNSNEIGPMRKEIDHSNEISLQLIRSPAISRDFVVKKLLGVPERCESFDYIELERRNIQTLMLSQPIELSVMRETTPYRMIAYYSGEFIQDNRDYWFEGWLQADPKTGESVLNLESAIPAKSAVEDYVVTENTFKCIEHFQLLQHETVKEHFQTLYALFEGMTGIFGRSDLIHGVIESMFSVIEFQVGQKHVKNGWVDVLFIGDTRTGKSEITKQIMEVVNVGELISCENVTAAGLLGGIEFVDKQPITVWGKMVQNDLGMIAFDEMSEMTGKNGKSDILAQLSSVRSSGVAEINKIQQSKANARVRSVYITNPRFGREITSFDSGIRSVQSVISNQEDIARFTKAYVVSSDTVSLDTILQDRKIRRDPNVLKFLNSLAILTWSLKSDQVEFTKEANEYLRIETKRIASKYHPSIPLIEKGSCFVKLAKLSVPIAVMCGSFIRTDQPSTIDAESDCDSGVKLIVQEEHCRFAIEKLEEHYDSYVCGYKRYSDHEKEREAIKNESILWKKLVECGDKLDKRVSIVDFLLANEVITFNAFVQALGRRFEADILWADMVQNNALRPIKSGNTEHMLKTSAFVKLLMRMLQNYKAVEEVENQDLEEKKRLGLVRSQPTEATIKPRLVDVSGAWTKASTEQPVEKSTKEKEDAALQKLLSPDMINPKEKGE